MTDPSKPESSQRLDDDQQASEADVTPYHQPADHACHASAADSIPLSAFPKLISSDELFGEERQVLIDHAGSVYRLQITKQGKLILTK